MERMRRDRGGRAGPCSGTSLGLLQNHLKKLLLTKVCNYAELPGDPFRWYPNAPSDKAVQREEDPCRKDLAAIATACTHGRGWTKHPAVRRRRRNRTRCTRKSGTQRGGIIRKAEPARARWDCCM